MPRCNDATVHTQLVIQTITAVPQVTDFNTANSEMSIANVTAWNS